MAWTARATSTLQQGRDAVDAAAPIWLTVWAAGVLVLALRMIGGAWWIRGLRRSSARLPERWTPIAASAMKQAGLTVPVPVRRSPRVDVPLVCGWLSPVVIVPERLLRTCPESELEALLVHELSHVRRHDVLVGWLQAGVETLLFFHPGAWWISRRIRRERELSTDDRVVGVGVSPRTCAEALTRVAEQAATLRPARGIALTPAASDGALLHRIRRVVLPAHEEPVHRASLLAATLTLLVVPLLATACSSISAPGDAQVAAETETEEVVTSTVVVPGGHGGEEAKGDRRGTVVVDSVIIRNGDTDVRRIIIRQDTAWAARLDSLWGGSVFADSAWSDQVRAFTLEADSLAEVIRRDLRPMTDELQRQLRGLDTLALDGLTGRGGFKALERRDEG
jgi:beta-lactamase regulating signal transducer with metallopeptidase domain